MILRAIRWMHGAGACLAAALLVGALGCEPAPVQTGSLTGTVEVEDADGERAIGLERGVGNTHTEKQEMIRMVVSLHEFGDLHQAILMVAKPGYAQHTTSTMAMTMLSILYGEQKFVSPIIIIILCRLLMGVFRSRETFIGHHVMS